MPRYIYTDDQDHETPIFHGMNEDPVITCTDCGEVMWRRPSKITGVNWGGLPPSQKPDSWVDDFVAGAPERREAFVQEHEAHEERTKNE